MMQTCRKGVSPSSEQRCRIEQIVALTPCRRGFACLTSRFQTLARLEAGEGGRGMRCLEFDAAECNLGVPLGDGTYCACLLRLYTAETFDL